MSTKAKRPAWTMPEWMEPFRDLILNTGGNSIEEMMNDTTDSCVNLPRAMLAVCVKSQVGFLSLMQRKGLLYPAQKELFAALETIADCFNKEGELAETAQDQVSVALEKVDAALALATGTP